jgi:hypothetical protein
VLYNILAAVTYFIPINPIAGRLLVCCLSGIAVVSTMGILQATALADSNGSTLADMSNSCSKKM